MPAGSMRVLSGFLYISKPTVNLQSTPMNSSQPQLSHSICSLQIIYHIMMQSCLSPLSPPMYPLLLLQRSLYSTPMTQKTYCRSNQVIGVQGYSLPMGASLHLQDWRRFMFGKTHQLVIYSGVASEPGFQLAAICGHPIQSQSCVGDHQGSSCSIQTILANCYPLEISSQIIKVETM